MKKNIIYLLISLSILIFISLVFYLGLNKPNSYIPKAINTEIVEFDSYELFSGQVINSKSITSKNNFTLINIWSSWCMPCRKEHPVLLELNKLQNLYLLGLNYKDKEKNSKKFLNQLENPFSLILTDPNGLISISLGAYGVPESLLINNKSKVIKKFIGPLTNKNYQEIKNIINNENN